MPIKFKFTLAAATLAATFHCAGKSSLQVAGAEVKAPAEATSVAARVLAENGATLSIGSSVQLTVPAGALAADTDISLRKNPTAPQQENLVPIGSSIELGAHGTEFNKAVALNVCYDASTLAAKGLSEDTLQVYYLDEQSGNYAAVGGQINKASHCVSAQLAHFSTYLIAAQILQGGNNPPVVSAPTFTPSVPLAGLPLKLSTVITDYELSTVSGQVGFGQVATAQLFYRIPGEPSYTQVSLTPDYSDDTATRYSYKIPANRVTTAGIEYYLKSTDNLGLNRLRNVATLNVARTATSIAFATTAAVDLAAGFKRSYTLRAIDDLGAARNIDVDTFTLNGGIGTAAKTGPSVIQVSATTAGAQNYRIGSLTATAGAFSVTSADIRVHAGMLDHIALLSPTGVVLGNSITVNANSTYDFDVLGYDAFGNTTNVLPLFVIVPVSGAGTISATGLYTAPATAQTATLVATLDGVQDSILINVVVPPAPTITLNDVGANATNPVIIQHSGQPYVGFHQAPQKLVVKTKSPSGWISLGSQVNYNVGSPVSTLELVSHDGQIYAGWIETGSGPSISFPVSRWDGTSWISVGSGPIISGPLNNAAMGNLVSFAGSLYVIIRAERPNPNIGFSDIREVTIHRWDGLTWTQVGVPIFSLPAAVWYNELVVHQGNLFAFISVTGTTYFSQWTGSSWTDIQFGTPRINSGLEAFMQFKLVSDGSLIWITSTDQGQIGTKLRATAFNPATLIVQNNVLINNAPPSISRPRIALNNAGQPIISYATGEIFVQEYNGSAWALYSGAGLTNTGNLSSSADITQIGTTKYVVYVESDGISQQNVRVMEK